MRNLLVMRHAKSDWGNSSLSDFDRPLNERGLKTAPFMGNEIKMRNKLPELIISSPANRAKTTAHLFAETTGFDGKMMFEDEFYFGSVDKIISIISKVDNQYETIMIVGHNPTWETIIYRLVKDSPGVMMPTAAVASLLFDICGWDELQARSAKLEFLLIPKELMNK
jgi:phosphohistidine phosphatase